MSFFNIKDAEERDAVIEDYLALKKRLKERNMAERGYPMDRQRALGETFQLVVASNEKMAQDTTKEELEEINRNIEMKKGALRPKIGSKRRLVASEDCFVVIMAPMKIAFVVRSPPESFLPKYMDDVVDRSFGRRDKILKIHGDNIMPDDEVYVGTSGLWTLITYKSPKTYTEEDYERYKELLHETNVLYRDSDRRQLSLS